MTSIYPDINSKIQSILEGVPKIKSIYPYPATKIDSYPAAIYFPSSLENSFESTAENLKTYNYKVWIVVNAGNKPVNEVFATVMPNVMDAVLQAFDDGWNFDTINGHRVWGEIETGSWEVSEEQAGVEIAGEINLSVKTLTNNN